MKICYSNIPEEYKNFKIIIGTDEIRYNKEILDSICPYFRTIRSDTMIINNSQSDIEELDQTGKIPSQQNDNSSQQNVNSSQQNVNSSQQNVNSSQQNVNSSQPNIVPILRWLGLPYYEKYSYFTKENIVDIARAVDYTMYPGVNFSNINKEVLEVLVKEYPFGDDFVSPLIIKAIMSVGYTDILAMIEQATSEYLFVKFIYKFSPEQRINWMINNDIYSEEIVELTDWSAVQLRLITMLTNKFPQSLEYFTGILKN